MVRRAEARDLTEILNIYAHARSVMAQTGNPTQWGGGFPPEEMLREDIAQGRLYALSDAEGVYGVFALIIGDDPTYAVIEGGRWRSDSPYGTLHRVAASGRVHGVLREAVAYSAGVIAHLRIDTHADNDVMQRQIKKCGFERCGVIHIADGSERIAYERL